MSYLTPRTRHRRLAPGGVLSAAFLPSDLSNLVAWFDAGLGTFQENTFTTPADDAGESVGGWQDQSGNGYDVTQATAGEKPTFQTGVVNGLPAIRFDGTDDGLRNTSFKDFGDNYTVFSVHSHDVGSGNSQATIEVSTGTGNTGWGVQLGGAGNIWRCRDASTNRDVSVSGLKDATMHIHTGILDGDNGLDYRRDKSSVGTQVYTSPNPNTLSQIDIGRTPGSYRLNGDIAEIIIYDRTLSSAEITDVENYLSSKYNL